MSQAHSNFLLHFLTILIWSPHHWMKLQCSWFVYTPFTTWWNYYFWTPTGRYQIIFLRRICSITHAQLNFTTSEHIPFFRVSGLWSGDVAAGSRILLLRARNLDFVISATSLLCWLLWLLLDFAWNKIPLGCLHRLHWPAKDFGTNSFFLGIDAFSFQSTWFSLTCCVIKS